MALIKITGSEKGSNKGSCSGLVQYLEKENKGREIGEKRHFFSNDKDAVTAAFVQEQVDRSSRGLKKADAKYYMITVAPSEAELKHLGNDKQKLMAYTRAVMKQYAAGFGRGLKSSDLVWYAKIEDNRYYKGTDEQVQRGAAKAHQPKHGENMHIHIIVSRKSKSGNMQLSPLTNHRKAGGIIRHGFDRSGFKAAGEKLFDEMFEYRRPVQQSYDYVNKMKNGSRAEKVEAKLKAVREQVAVKLQQQRVQEKGKEQQQGKQPGTGLGL